MYRGVKRPEKDTRTIKLICICHFCPDPSIHFSEAEKYSGRTEQYSFFGLLYQNNINTEPKMHREK